MPFRLVLGLAFVAQLAYGSVMDNMDTEADVNTYCNLPALNQTEWQQYTCKEVSKGLLGWDRCWPQKRYSRCQRTNGFVVLFHGYSACPEANSQLASHLQDACLQVYIPLTPGHGRKYNDCDPNSPSCVAGKYDLTDLPTSRSGYETFTNNVMKAVLDDYLATLSTGLGSLDVVAVGGLSLGAGLAVGALQAPLAAFVTDVMLMNPFLGISATAIDDVDKCIGSVDELLGCVSAGLKDTPLASVSDLISSFSNSSGGDMLSEMILVAKQDKEGFVQSLNYFLRQILELVVETATPSDLLETVVGWGESCLEDESKVGRSGFCSFQAKHILAAHSFAQSSIRKLVSKGHESALKQTKPRILMMGTERDGRTRNGLAFQLMRDADIDPEAHSACIWRTANGCEGVDNECGVPHSCLAEKDNMLRKPYYMYWNQTLLDGLTGYLTSTSMPQKFMAKEWDESRDECVAESVLHPNPSLASVMDPVDVLVLAERHAQVGPVKEAVTKGMCSLIGAENYCRAALGLFDFLGNGTVATTNDFDRCDGFGICYLHFPAMPLGMQKMMNETLSHVRVDSWGGYKVSGVKIQGEYYDEIDRSETPAFGSKQIMLISFGSFVVIAGIITIWLAVARHKRRSGLLLNGDYRMQ